MIFRRKLLVVFTLTVFLSVAAVAGLVLSVTRRAFDASDQERTTALFTQFQKEFNRQGEEIVRRVAAIAGSEPLSRVATAVNQGSDSAVYFDLAKTMADNYQLDFLEFADSHGHIISSAQWPAKYGYPDTSFESVSPAAGQAAFLKQEELEDSTAVGLFAVRTTHVGENPVYVIGGRRLDKSFLSGLDLPADMRALLYLNRGEHFSADLLLDPSAGSALPAMVLHPAEKFAPLIEAVQKYNQETTAPVHWSSDQADDELFHAIPLRGGGSERPLLGILLIGTSRRSYVMLKRHIGSYALLVGSGGMLVAILLSTWAAARVTRPVVRLAVAAREVADGNWSARVAVSGHDELAQLAESFNHMTAELLNQRERLVQAERVAAWRELARRLAHELKNPLFPLQLTVENLVRAREQTPNEFDEVFRESARTLLAEIANLKGIVGRFSEFSKMPHPQLQEVSVNEVLQRVAQLFQAQLQAPGRAPIACRLELDENLEPIAADPELLHRAVSNLVLNAMDAMPQGGALTLRSRREDGTVTVEVADTGSGMTLEECERIFTPYYTSKQHGTGLGLAIVQSVVSDHGGRISVQSAPGKGTTFVVELPATRVERIAADIQANEAVRAD